MLQQLAISLSNVATPTGLQAKGAILDCGNLDRYVQNWASFNLWGNEIATIETKNVYREARKRLKRSINVVKRKCCTDFIETVDADPCWISYKVVMRKFRGPFATAQMELGEKWAQLQWAGKHGYIVWGEPRNPFLVFYCRTLHMIQCSKRNNRNRLCKWHVFSIKINDDDLKHPK